MENKWSDALQKGKQVEVEIIPKYKDLNKRPDSFNVFYEIDGVESFKKFNNKAGG